MEAQSAENNQELYLIDAGEHMKPDDRVQQDDFLKIRLHLFEADLSAFYTNHALLPFLRTYI